MITKTASVQFFNVLSLADFFAKSLLLTLRLRAHQNNKKNNFSMKINFLFRFGERMLFIEFFDVFRC